MQPIDHYLEQLKDIIGIEFGQTVNGSEIKGYHDGDKIYLSGVNCIEMAELFLAIAYHLESVDNNFNSAEFKSTVGDRLVNLLNSFYVERKEF